ncbi:MAG: M28 family peptidase [Gammaproteobacteria bacterium]
MHGSGPRRGGNEGRVDGALRRRPREGFRSARQAGRARPARRNSRSYRIYNGALDTGAGIATMLEVARAAASAPDKPRRSILFLATTAEVTRAMADSERPPLWIEGDYFGDTFAPKAARAPRE